MEREEYWDGNKSLLYSYNDGGREEAGYKGKTGDCVVRAVAIAAQLPYQKIYDDFTEGQKSNRKTRRTRKSTYRTVRNGIYTKRKWFKDYMKKLGFVWVPTMLVGQGCKVHLLDGELPLGRLVVAVSRHYTAVIDGVINDTYDPTRSTITTINGTQYLSHRCVYGYWRLERN